jgi:hypothetical protein
MTNLPAAIIADAVLGNDPVGIVGQVPEVACDPEVLLHRAPDHGDPPVEAGRRVENLLDPGDVAGEGRHDDPAVERLHDLAERVADRPLGRRVSRVLRPGRIREEAHDALLAQLGQDVKVRQPAVDRGVVELEVAGMHDDANRRAQGDPHRVGDGVADPERDHREGPDGDLVAGLQAEERVVVKLVLLDLVAEQPARQDRRVDGHAGELREHVRQGPDVILVRMRDEERPDVGAALLQVADVGNDEIDAEHLLVGEHQAAVDDDDVVAVLEHVHVLADLAHAPQGDDAKRRVVGNRVLAGHGLT